MANVLNIKSNQNYYVSFLIRTISLLPLKQRKRQSKYNLENQPQQNKIYVIYKNEEERETLSV